MALSAGSRLGPYEITSLLGAGGMGEVYLARDSKLRRNLALKVLPETFVHDSERLARFDREAQLLASLNHPNIAAIYGLEESSSIRALVMEFVDGPTLSDRLALGPIALDEALLVAKQMAEALEFAHAQNIIHMGVWGGGLRDAQRAADVRWRDGHRRPGCRRRSRSRLECPSCRHAAAGQTFAAALSDARSEDTPARHWRGPGRHRRDADDARP